MLILFQSNAEQKKYIEHAVRRGFPSFKTGGFFFRKYIQKRINQHFQILDAGCGTGGMLSEFKHIPKKIIGIDADSQSLDKNTIISNKIHGSLERIPLGDSSMDMVISEFVIEHLKNPLYVFREINRVLKPTGVFVFITPNIINPIMLSSKLLPYSIHTWMRKKFLKKNEKTHKTYYRANSYHKLIRLGKRSGFKNTEIKRAGNPEYLGFMKPLVPIAVTLEKTIDTNFFQIFKMYLIGCFTK